MVSNPSEWHKLVRSQYQKICAHDLFRTAERLKKILGYMLEASEKGETLKHAVIAENVYGKKPKGNWDDEQLAPVKAACGQIRQKLAVYYGSAGLKDPIIIEMEKGVVAVKCSLRGSNEQDPIQPGDDTLPGTSIDCRYLGNDSEAMEYVLEQYRSKNSPRLIGLRDTHVRAEVPLRVRHGYYQELQAAFTAFLQSDDLDTFLKSGDSDNTKCALIFGREFDSAYVRMVQLAATGTGNKLKCYLLRNSGLPMNFICLDYQDSTTEVLFGWGLGKQGWPGAVFASKNGRLVEYFNNFYEVLLKASDPVSVESLLETPVHKEPPRTPPQIP